MGLERYQTLKTLKAKLRGGGWYTAKKYYAHFVTRIINNILNYRYKYRLNCEFWVSVSGYLEGHFDLSVVWFYL